MKGIKRFLWLLPISFFLVFSACDSGVGFNNGSSDTPSVENSDDKNKNPEIEDSSENDNKNLVSENSVSASVTKSKPFEFKTNISGNAGDVIKFSMKLRGASIFKQTGFQSKTLDNERWHDGLWKDNGILDGTETTFEVTAQSDFSNIEWKVFIQQVVSDSKDTSEVTLYDITIENTSNNSGFSDESENESNNESDNETDNESNNETDNESNEDSEVDENIKFESDDVFTSERTFDFISDMQIGWNLGNALDANNNGVSSETAWGNPTITQTLFTKVKEAGFQVVRIPITWLGHIGNAPNYTIEESFLNRVSEVVGYAKNAGLKAIINIHHDGADSAHWLNIKDAATNSTINTAVKNQLYSMWTQIAQKFPNSEDYLIFETMNEIHDGKWGWGDNRNDGGKQYNTLNEWNQICVNAIRNTGAKNFISIPGYVTNPTLTMEHLVLPTDELNKLFVTVHFYEPNAFTLKAIVPKWGKTVPESELKYDNPYGEGTLTLSGEDAIDSMYKKLYEKYIQNGIPVLVSECGATHQSGYENYRRYYTEYMVKSAHDNELIPILWDNGVSGSGSESSGLFNRSNGEIYSHAKTIVEAAIKAATTEYTEIELP